MAAAALLKEKPTPTDKDIDEAMTNICRCGTYQRVRAAIHLASKMRVASAGDWPQTEQHANAPTFQSAPAVQIAQSASV